MLEALACRCESADQPRVTRKNDLSECLSGCRSTHLDSDMAGYGYAGRTDETVRGWRYKCTRG